MRGGCAAAQPMPPPPVEAGYSMVVLMIAVTILRPAGANVPMTVGGRPAPPRPQWIGRPFPPGVQPQQGLGPGGAPGQNLTPDGRPSGSRPRRGSSNDR